MRAVFWIIAGLILAGAAYAQDPGAPLISAIAAGAAEPLGMADPVRIADPVGIADPGGTERIAAPPPPRGFDGESEAQRRVDFERTFRILPRAQGPRVARAYKPWQLFRPRNKVLRQLTQHLGLKPQEAREVRGLIQLRGRALPVLSEHDAAERARELGRLFGQAYLNQIMDRRQFDKLFEQRSLRQALRLLRDAYLVAGANDGSEDLNHNMPTVLRVGAGTLGVAVALSGIAWEPSLLANPLVWGSLVTLAAWGNYPVARQVLTSEPSYPSAEKGYIPRWLLRANRSRKIKYITGRFWESARRALLEDTQILTTEERDRIAKAFGQEAVAAAMLGPLLSHSSPEARFAICEEWLE